MGFCIENQNIFERDLGKFLHKCFEARAKKFLNGIQEKSLRFFFSKLGQLSPKRFLSESGRRVFTALYCSEMHIVF